jgi:hypothetical protein
MCKGIMRLPLAHTSSLVHRHNTPTQMIRRWIFMIACLYPNYKTRALVLHSTDRPADLLVLVRGLDSDQPDMARHAVDVTVYDPIGSSNLTDVRKALSSPSADPAIGETRDAGSIYGARLGAGLCLSPHGF